MQLVLGLAAVDEAAAAPHDDGRGAQDRLERGAPISRS
jgi:hypothetical protein